MLNQYYYVWRMSGIWEFPNQRESELSFIGDKRGVLKVLLVVFKRPPSLE